MQTRLPFLSSLPTSSNTELSAVPGRPIHAPENTGCDTACMRLAVGLAGGRDSLGMLQEMLQDTQELLPRAFGAKTCTGLLTFHPGILPPLPCESLQAMQPQHMQDAGSLGGVALGLSRNRLGAGSPHYQLLDSEVPGSKI